ncbi:T9SS type A sorting domain-containing protein [Mariniflexile sp.]|uniref:T9SS type A sorting domain-containing protein n=1 Tax=Mariniflexile sp. TaxID=1979402 RepID=UPI00356A84C6
MQSQTNLLVRSTTGTSGNSAVIVQDNASYMVQESIGQPSAIGTFNNGSYSIRQGFIQPNVLSQVMDINVPLNLQVSIYPNPFKEQISLTFNEDIEGEVVLTVCNMLGANVFFGAFASLNQIDVKLNNLQSGEYILKAVANNKQFIGKILKN